MAIAKRRFLTLNLTKGIRYRSVYRYNGFAWDFGLVYILLFVFIVVSKDNVVYVFYLFAHSFLLHRLLQVKKNY